MACIIAHKPVSHRHDFFALKLHKRHKETLCWGERNLFLHNSVGYSVIWNSVINSAFDELGLPVFRWSSVSGKFLQNQNGDGLNVKVERWKIMNSKGSPNLPSFITGHYGPNSSSSRAFESLVRTIGEAKSKQASGIGNCMVSFYFTNCLL